MQKLNLKLFFLLLLLSVFFLQNSHAERRSYSVPQGSVQKCQAQRGPDGRMTYSCQDPNVRAASPRAAVSTGNVNPAVSATLGTSFTKAAPDEGGTEIGETAGAGNPAANPGLTYEGYLRHGQNAWESIRTPGGPDWNSVATHRANAAQEFIPTFSTQANVEKAASVLKTTQQQDAWRATAGLAVQGWRLQSYNAKVNGFGDFTVHGDGSVSQGGMDKTADFLQFVRSNDNLAVELSGLTFAIQDEAGEMKTATVNGGYNTSLAQIVGSGAPKQIEISRSEAATEMPIATPAGAQETTAGQPKPASPPLAAQPEIPEAKPKANTPPKVELPPIEEPANVPPVKQKETPKVALPKEPLAASPKGKLQIPENPLYGETKPGGNAGQARWQQIEEFRKENNLQRLVITEVGDETKRIAVITPQENGKYTTSQPSLNRLGKLTNETQVNLIIFTKNPVTNITGTGPKTLGNAGRLSVTIPFGEVNKYIKIGQE